jgi:hypothetical protein
VQEDAPDDPALVTYEQAESLLAAGHPTRALGMLKSIAGHPSSLLVPKATYSVGWIYENVLHDADSATAWYRTLLSSYPSSAYALDAAPRVAVKDDSTSLEKYVKFKRIDAVPKPPKPNFGRRNIPVERTRLPGEENDRGIRDPNDEEADPDEEEPEEEDPEPEDPDDEGGEL